MMMMSSLQKVAYFSMEMAIDQSLHVYSGGLGFLSGSHMLSAGKLNLPMVGISLLWTSGYGDQAIDVDDTIQINYVQRTYPFLKDTGVTVEVQIFGETVKVKPYLLEPTTFGTVPCYFLTTDIAGNTQVQRNYSNKLYDSDDCIRVAQEIILGVAGVRALNALGVQFDIVHMNEGHALPAAFELLRLYGQNLEAVRRRLVFTTHTPVAAGNECHPVELLQEAGFFVETSKDEAIRLGGYDFSLTVAALRMSRLANGVSQLHGEVANNMWNWVGGRCKITAITNATSLAYWQDPRVKAAETDEQLRAVKRAMRGELLEYIQKETGTVFDPEVFTLVWARRFTEYKRADLIFKDLPRIKRLLEQKKLQLVFAGKFHPKDTWGRETYNKIIKLSRELPGVVVLPGYELALSGILKRGADLWLNTPLRPLEASGTSGMSANFNGAVHMSTFDGWAVEGTYAGYNGYIINGDTSMDNLPLEERHQRDYESMMNQLEFEALPTFYHKPSVWAGLMRRAIQFSSTYFDSDRMAIEYYTRLYQPALL
jgi:starch phosphorylase